METIETMVIYQLYYYSKVRNLQKKYIQRDTLIYIYNNDLGGILNPVRNRAKKKTHAHKIGKYIYSYTLIQL